MAIGTGDGEYYESRIDHQLASFEDRAEPVRDAISSGTFDPQGDNFTSFKSPKGSPTEPAGAFKSIAPILSSGVFK